MSIQIARTPAGVPTGGQFASHDRADGAVALTRPMSAALRALVAIDEIRTRTAKAAISSEVLAAYPSATLAVFEFDSVCAMLTLTEVYDEAGQQLVVDGELGEDVRASVLGAEAIARTLPNASRADRPLVIGIDANPPRVVEVDARRA